MEAYDVKRLALVLAVQAEIEGMKAENLRSQAWDGSIRFQQHDFIDKSHKLQELAHAHDDQLVNF